MILSVALNVQKIVQSIAKTFGHANGIYNDVVKDLQERKLLRLEVQQKELKLRQQELQFIDAALKKMAKLLDVSSPAALNKLTGHPYRSLKILLSLYRRIRTLVKYQNDGKADFIKVPTSTVGSQNRRRTRKGKKRKAV